MFEIPRELVMLAAERRLIPFVGAGFSTALNLPNWESMLRELCEQIEDAMPFDELLEATDHDYLQVAEYLFLKCDRQIGPIRRQLEKSLGKHESPLTSGPHVELLNLRAAQIYTTNYDDLIETAYRELQRPISPIILPKDVALSDTERTQIVKYHGDLVHERTLVLTESAYYKRLNFESPMDLKFRSDLLGKSVLFMGYSFRDINIRIIWFKLMEMMRDIPEADRRPSYIVRLEPNAALDELNAAVGLKTIVLNPDGPVESAQERVRLMGDFLYELSSQASEASGRSSGAGDVVSQALLDRMSRFTSEANVAGAKQASWRLLRYVGMVEEAAVNRMLEGEVPKPLYGTWQEALQNLARVMPVRSANDVTRLVGKLEESQALTEFVVRILATVGDPELRRVKQGLLKELSLWRRVWSRSISVEVVESLTKAFSEEIRYQARVGADDDIAYLADLVKRVSLRQLAQDVPDEILEKSDRLLELAAQIYPSVADMRPETDGPPAVTKVLEEVAAREKRFKPVQLGSDGVAVFDARRLPASETRRHNRTNSKRDLPGSRA